MTAARRRDVLWLIATGALAAGLGETGLRFALLPHRELLSSRIYLNPQSVWMGPVVNALLMLVPVWLAFLIGRRVKGGKYAYASAVLVATFLSVFTVSMITRRVSDLALAALAIGVASQVARLAHHRPRLVQLLTRRVAIVLAIVSAGAAAVVNGRDAIRERRMLAGLPAAADGAPNVLLLVLDTVRGLELGVGGYPRPTTPNIDRWASRGVVFDRAIAPSPWTLPTHASLFTGKWPHELGIGWSTPFGEGHTTIAERMNALGYATGGFAANLIYCSYLFGLHRGFSTYQDYRFSPSELLGASTLGRRIIDLWNRTRGAHVIVGRKTAAEINSELLAWEGDVKPGRPWFAFVNYFDAHDPYDPVPPYRDMFPGTSEGWRSIFDLRVRSAEERAGLQAAYDGALAYLDMEIGRLLDDLDRRGVLRNTLVIITSDHGEAFGEHGTTGHGSSLYTPVIHVPLVVLPPAAHGAGRRLARFVSLRDVAATIEEAARPTSREMPGVSLQPLWMGDTLTVLSPPFSEVDRLAALPDRYPISKTGLRSLIAADRWHYIRSGEGREELYDLTTDFLEQRNLAPREEHASRLRLMRDSLAVLAGRAR
ncbi:MAG: sulfatase [Gemmatimonadaceae bacterium]